MPIVKCESSKATPYKGIAYILDETKVEAQGSQSFVSLLNDPKQMAKQMMQTMLVHGKGTKRNERKYYHAKVSFDPRDLPENGGNLTPERANAYAAMYAATMWPGREVVWSVQKHGEARHIHFIVAAVEQETGKKMDARDGEYRRWKDQAQTLAQQLGFIPLDWRQATADKRAGEVQPDLPVVETFAEQGMKARGKSSWKEDLRSIIDDAAGHCTLFKEFKEELEKKGVVLTRSTETTISFKYGDHKACRGDTLGGDYTAAAIRSALRSNREQAISKRKPSVDALIMGERQEEISQEERELFRELGRMAGVKRAEVDAMIDEAPKATWAEKQASWEAYKAARDSFWAEYAIRQQNLKNELNTAYKRRRRASNAEWALDPRNRRKSLIGVLYASIVLRRYGSRYELEYEIEQLKKEQQQLRQDMADFKKTTGAAVGTLREKGLSLDAYMERVKSMQIMADLLAKKNGWMNEETREKLQKQAEQAKKNWTR